MWICICTITLNSQRHLGYTSTAALQQEITLTRSRGDFPISLKERRGPTIRNQCGKAKEQQGHMTQILRSQRTTAATLLVCETNLTIKNFTGKITYLYSPIPAVPKSYLGNMQMCLKILKNIPGGKKCIFEEEILK